MSDSHWKIAGIRTTTETGSCLLGEAAGMIESRTAVIGDGHAVCWLHQSVMIGRIAGGKLSFHDGTTAVNADDLMELRLFDENGELFLWRVEEGFRYRLRTDGSGDDAEVVDTLQPLWGTKVLGEGSGWSSIAEDRGIRLEAPFTGLRLTPTERLALKCRNYIEFNDQHQAGFTDCRFMGFELPGGEA